MDCFDEEGEIDASLNGLAQDDPVVVDALKNYYLTAPANELPYKIDKYRLDPNLLQVSSYLAKLIFLI